MSEAHFMILTGKESQEGKLISLGCPKSVQTENANKLSRFHRELNLKHCDYKLPDQLD